MKFLLHTEIYQYIILLPCSLRHYDWPMTGMVHAVSTVNPNLPAVVVIETALLAFAQRHGIVE